METELLLEKKSSKIYLDEVNRNYSFKAVKQGKIYALIAHNGMKWFSIIIGNEIFYTGDLADLLSDGVFDGCKFYVLK